MAKRRSEPYRLQFGRRLSEAIERWVLAKDGRSLAGVRAGMRGLGVEVSKSGLSNHKSGAGEPSLEVIHAYARVLGCTPGWLAFGDGPAWELRAVPGGKAASVEEALRADPATRASVSDAREAGQLVRRFLDLDPSRRRGVETIIDLLGGQAPAVRRRR
jgi:hypothetical protein